MTYIHGHRGREVRPIIEQPADASIRHIALTDGFIAVVDTADFEIYGGFAYHREALGYAVRHLSGYRRVKLHREIMGDPKGMEVDHVNGDPLDNRRVNLRVCHSWENSFNRKLAVNNTSGFTGVSWNSERRLWMVSIRYRGRVIRLGGYVDKQVAISVRMAAEKKYFGEFVRALEHR